MNYGKIDLHLHLDGSIYLPWAYQTALKNGSIDKDMTYEQYYARMYFKGYKTREEGFKKFEYACDVLQTKEDLIMGIWHLIRTLNDQGLYYAEIRYASQQHTNKGLTQRETVAALCEGIAKAKKDFPNIEIGLINCMMHKGPDAHFNEAANYETIEATKEFLGKGVVGIDLAGYENNGDFRLYKPLFDKIHEYSIPCTCHAAEMGIGEHIMDALSFGVNRIGHGINCVDNPEWLKAVVDSKIPLEVCVSSNQKDHEYQNHPIRQLLEAGAKVTINTDNMMFSHTTLGFEYDNLAALGIDQETLYQCALNSADAAFCSPQIKEKLKNKLKKLHDNK